MSIGILLQGLDLLFRKAESASAPQKIPHSAINEVALKCLEVPETTPIEVAPLSSCRVVTSVPAESSSSSTTTNSHTAVPPSPINVHLANPNENAAVSPEEQPKESTILLLAKIERDACNFPSSYWTYTPSYCLWSYIAPSYEFSSDPWE